MKTTREKIILGLMGLAVLYFVYDFFLVDGADEPVPTEAHDAALAMAVELQRDLAAGKFDPPAQVLAALAGLQETTWSSARFVGPDFVLLEELVVDEREHAALEELRAAAGRLVYSGYLEMAGRRLAVLNGKEYSVGDTVNGNLRLQRIEPNFLELGWGEQVVQVPIVDLE